jgi:hypothetical protein
MRNVRPSPVVNVSPTCQVGVRDVELAEVVAVRREETVPEHTFDLKRHDGALQAISLEGDRSSVG